MKKMLTIDDYVEFTDNLKETGQLSSDFHIIQYKDGCCLGVNGKSREFEDSALDMNDYIFWNEGGHAHKLINAESRSVVYNDNGDLVVQYAPALVPCSELNHPYSDEVAKGLVEYTLGRLMSLCDREDRIWFAFISERHQEGPLTAWVGGNRSNLVSAFWSLIRKDKQIAGLIHDAIEQVVNGDAPTDTSVS